MWRPISIVITGLMAVATLTLALASVIHFGNTVSLGVVTFHDPFRGAALPEAIIAVVLAVGLVSVLLRLPAAWWIALATTVFALAGVILGLSIVLLSSARRSGDIVYHVSLLTVLVITVGVLLTPGARQGLGSARS
jgi:hypothetical protein